LGFASAAFVEFLPKMSPAGFAGAVVGCVAPNKLLVAGAYAGAELPKRPGVPLAGTSAGLACPNVAEGALLAVSDG